MSADQERREMKFDDGPDRMRRVDWKLETDLRSFAISSRRDSDGIMGRATDSSVCICESRAIQVTDVRVLPLSSQQQ